MAKLAHLKREKDLGQREYTDSTAQSRQEAWEELCARYLPVVPERSIWRYSRAPMPDDPAQGWKLHISATVLSANRVLERVAPLLLEQGVLFKAAFSLEELGRLNCGLFYGFSQVGKFITVYPKTSEMAVSLARQCHQLTCRLNAPHVPYDLPFRENGCVYYRYGAFTALEIEQPDGTRVPAVRNNDGILVPDLRKPGAAAPSWEGDPFVRNECRRANGKTAASPLSTTFLAYEAISQRGKGGVYRALDLSGLPARRCVLKEGRRHGETEWDGRDGYWRVRHEATVLRALSSAGVNVPRVYATFQAEKHYYLVTEYIEGHTLQSLLANKRKKLPISRALEFGRQLADLVSQIHAAGWVWRDCKPLNLIVSKDEVLRPVDFEGACSVDLADQTPWGTTGYLPPGSARRPTSGSRVPDDLYALGVTLHQLLTSRTPNTDLPPPVGKLRRHVTAAMKGIVSALLDPDSTARPDAGSVSQALALVCTETEGSNRSN